MSKMKSYIFDLFDDNKLTVQNSERIQDAEFWTTDRDAYLSFGISRQGFVINKAIINLYNKSDKTLLIDEPMTILNNEARFKMPSDVMSHFGKWSVQVIFNDVYTSPAVDFDILRALGSGIPDQMGLIHEWEKLNNEVKAFVAEIEGFTLEEFVALKMGEELSKLEVNYATRLTGLEQKDNQLAAQLAQAKNLREITYITPYDFGAIGDNITDDTEALRQALWTSHTLGVILFFPSGCKCRVTAPLNYINNEYQDLDVNIKGSTPSGTWLYVLGDYGGISLNAKTALFKDAVITGSIKNMTIVGRRDIDYHFFENCKVRGMNILENTISNFGSFAYDSNITRVARIDLNVFLTVFSFFRHKEIGREITDSFITNNYINGGEEPTDNVCFEFSNGNGSVVQGNFIDYYHTIYKPPVKHAVQLPTSIGNQYQVFLYFYDFFDTTITSVYFLSSGDTFNWTRKDRLAHLEKYKERTIVTLDDVTRTVPTYIYAPFVSCHIVIDNAKIESHVGNIAYIHTSLTEYTTGQARASFLGVNRYTPDKITYLDGDKPYYIGGVSRQSMIEPFFIVEVDELPSTGNWGSYPNGALIRYNNQNYRLINKYDSSQSIYVPTWVEVDDI